MYEGERDGSSWRDHADQLYRHFGATAQHRCMLWVDPAQADPFEGHRVVEKSRVRVPIRHPRFEPSLAPYLVPLDLSCDDEIHLFSSSVELAWESWGIEHLNAMLGQPVCGWVSSSWDARVVARHWGTRCHLQMWNRQARLCRFQDPGVREWLWPTLSKTQQRTMLGPANEIVAIGRKRQLVHHAIAGSDERASSFTIQDIPPLQFSQATWGHLDDYATVHAAWLTWRHSVDEDVVLAQVAGWEQPIFHALTQARQLGIHDTVDCELFALHALRLGPSFYRDPKLGNVWTKTQAGEFYGNAVEEVTGLPADRLGI